MRPERPGDDWFPVAAAALLASSAAGLGALVGGDRGALGGAVLGLAGGLGVRALLARPAERRRRLLATPFPDAWRALLASLCDHYDRLPAELKPRFEDDVRVFLAEKRVTGVDAEVDDELRLLVAASAITLSLGWPDFEWDRLSEVLLYPQDFDRDYTFRSKELSGQAHGWGTVIMSIPTLRHSFAVPDDGYHVGFHEFAHLLDVEQSDFDGIPVGMTEARAREWVELSEEEMRRLHRGKSVLDPYAQESRVEFLAVAVEAFFEVPLDLRGRHRELYAILSEYFAQDPAAWDEVRGGG